ncbi:uncharacterized protein LOC144992416 isoform X2 [Oryzias latipes]
MAESSSERDQSQPELLKRDSVTIFCSSGNTTLWQGILQIADNNCADTHLAFFSDAVNVYGFPLRIEPLWCDVFASLDVFSDAWDSHPIRTEQSMTPNQLWQLGLTQNPVSDPRGMLVPEIEWEESGSMTEPHPGINVLVWDSPLLGPQMLELQDDINTLWNSDRLGVDLHLYCPCLELNLGDIITYRRRETEGRKTEFRSILLYCSRDFIVCKDVVKISSSLNKIQISRDPTFA